MGIVDLCATLYWTAVNSYFKIYKRKKFRAANRDNLVSINTTSWKYLDLNAITVGRGSYGNINVEFYNNPNERLSIGSYCSIAPNTTFICGGNHNERLISTYPFKAVVKGDPTDAVTNGPIVVDDDVWIGYGVTVLSGVHIGQGAVIAAGAVVTKNVPPYAVVGGVPAKIIKYRFEPEMIGELLKLDYSGLTKELIEEHFDELYTELKDKSQLTWMPKKHMGD